MAVLITLFLISAAVSWSEKNKEEQVKDLVAAAQASTDLNQQPYQLRAHVKVQFKVMVEGDLRVDWNPPDQHRTEIKLPDYREIRVNSHSQRWVQRPFNFTPLRIHQAFSLLHPAKSVNGKVKKIYAVVRGGTNLTCILAENGPSGEEACFETQHHFLVTQTTHDPFWTNVAEYSDYQPVGSKLYPRRMTLYENGVLVAEITVEDISLSTAPDASFSALAGVQPQPACTDGKPPQAVQMPDPSYDEAARQKRVRGTVTLELVINSGGRVEQAAVIRSLDPGLDREALNAVKKWRFRPALCGSTAMPAEIMVNVNFALY